VESQVTTPTRPYRQVCALYDKATLTVFQAYSQEIADSALTAGTFTAPFKFNRMTWIKPSFLWMMYRSAWAMKPRQRAHQRLPQLL
jgi:pre-mRNA-splicing factor ATP-dependent RNA helicase DHX16